MRESSGNVERHNDPRTHRGRQRRTDPRCGSRSPAGARGPQCAGRDHIQLVLTDRSPLTQGQDRGVIGTQTWRLADLGSKHMLLKEGIGWGYMPAPMVREDVEAGRLVRLDMREYKDGFMRLHAIYRTDTPPGPAGS